MALIINHNVPAIKAARNLGVIYNSLTKSVERLSSGLRINNAADDAAGLAIRELMRADIAATNQGIRNAADALSLVQTADGALGVIDAKLIHMKELAEQAANAIYTTVQRELINSEYQAMAAEIDRIAASTNFNGVKLLDGSMNSLNNGQGMMIHFGVNNILNEDYYYIKTDDARATTATGLQIGGDGKNDIWSTGSYPGVTPGGLKGCCGGGFSSPTEEVQNLAAQGFAYGYNWDNKQPDEDKLMSAYYLAGRYSKSGATLEDIVSLVNQGTQSRIGIKIAADLAPTGTDYTVICLGQDEAFYVGDKDAASAAANANLRVNFGGKAEQLASAINNHSQNFWAMLEGSTVYVFAKDPGDHNDWEAEEKGSQATDLQNITFINVLDGTTNDKGGKFSMGGEHWATMEINPNGTSYAASLLGRDIGKDRDLRIVKSNDTDFSDAITGITAAVLSKLNGDTFSEIQNAADGIIGAEIRTQEAGQKALASVTNAIVKKDNIRARFGAYAERLEATMEALTIQAENLQIAESRISDVDVATEMTEFTKNNVLAQAATAMLAQANSLSSLVLTLLR
ncbi:MAG: flagellin [Deltaproteobacteria bacterium]|jgi:flagellin|nr:flagellin [Deltaproteobacteria bacterium]